MKPQPPNSRRVVDTNVRGDSRGFSAAFSASSSDELWAPGSVSDNSSALNQYNHPVRATAVGNLDESYERKFCGFILKISHHPETATKDQMERLGIMRDCFWVAFFA